MKANKKYRQLNQFDRDRIQALCDAQVEQKEIARILNRDPSTISREIQRNRRKRRTKRGTRDGPYEARVADHKAYVRRLYATYQGKKIWENDIVRRYITRRLKRGWAPEVISGRMRQEGRPFYASKTAIYAWLYTANGQRWCHLLPSQRYSKKRRVCVAVQRQMIPHRIGIEQRPASAEYTYGHFEGDTLVSGKKTHSTAALAVLEERQAKYVAIRKIASLRPQLFTNAVITMQDTMQTVHSLTLDNGMENRYYEQIGTPTYFCDPYSSWQKGRVENMIALIRRYVPKGTDIRSYSDQYIAWVAHRLNTTPRKSLKYQTPYEVMVKHNLLSKKITPSPIALGG